MKFIDKVAENHIAVESQDLDVEFCFAKPLENGDYEGVSYFSVCRDFLGDTVCADAFKNESSIYGFTHNGETHPLYQTKTILGMRFPNQSIRNQFYVNIQRYKKWIGALANTSRKTINVSFPDDDLTAVVEADKMWQQTTVGISLFSFILKGLCWDFEEDYENLFEAIANTQVEMDSPTKEANYALGYEKQLTALLLSIKELTAQHKYPHGYDQQDQHISKVHNNSGFFFAIRWKRDTLVGKWAATLV